MSTQAVSTVPGSNIPAIFNPQSFEALKEMSDYIVKGNLVPQHVKNGADMAGIILQAMRWRMDPLAVAQATSVVHGKLCYEGKLVHAALISLGAIDGRLTPVYEGKGDDRVCIVSGTLKGEKEPRTWKNRLGSVKTKSGAWSSEPDKMLFYRTSRDWARMWAPEVMLGVSTPDEAVAEDIRTVDATVVEDGRADDGFLPPPEKKEAEKKEEKPPLNGAEGPQPDDMVVEANRIAGKIWDEAPEDQRHSLLRGVLEPYCILDAKIQTLSGLDETQLASLLNDLNECYSEVSSGGAQ